LLRRFMNFTPKRGPETTRIKREAIAMPKEPVAAIRQSSGPVHAHWPHH
jgi:hypothetical protein